MNEYSNAGNGLKFMFVASVGATICLLAALIPIVNILALVGSLVFVILSMIGLYNAGKDLEGCRTAFILTLVHLFTSFLQSLFGSSFLGTIFSLANSLLALLIIYFVCSSVNEALNSLGHPEVAGTGNTVWKINLICTIITIVVDILAWVPFLTAIAGITNILVLIASLVGSILYMIYLYKSYGIFGA